MQTVDGQGAKKAFHSTTNSGRPLHSFPYVRRDGMTLFKILSFIWKLVEMPKHKAITTQMITSQSPAKTLYVM